MDHFWHDLPDPTGKAPFRVDLSEILAADEIKKITAAGHLTFHAAGDTGNIRSNLQTEVAALMDSDAAASDPKFFYHLGDVVYDYGEDREYPGQFYDIYKDYALPIFAIPGNHDGARYSGGPDSLLGFMVNFCAPAPAMPPSLEKTGRHYGRDTMTQPNCYWTLNTPLFTIVGIYTNVPSGGDVREPQVTWFANEIADAPANRPLFVAMHHPVHSIALGSHAGSKAMEQLLISACTKAKRVPELVLCGHVHNYQRFETTFLNKPCMFVVAGMGGHAKDKLQAPHANDTKITHDYPVTLKIATDQHVGFLRVKVSAKPKAIECDYLAVGQAKPIDSFKL
jgi:3',5'-cyclic AMP phosphodiesterase CpdA